MKARQNTSTEDLPPHLFNVGANIMESFGREDIEQTDHSILISGESGSGKTESTKFLLKFFSEFGGNKSLEEKVLQTNPILEAFGNASTVRNANSSRFGKLIQLQFNDENSLVGAFFATYLLEKIRLVRLNKGERNFHILYQVCKGLSNEKKIEWGLWNFSCEDFRWLNQGHSLTLDSVDDCTNFQETINALQTLGFTTECVDNILKILCGLLYLGNVNFSEDSGQNECITMRELEKGAELLGIQSNILKSAFMEREVMAGGRDKCIVKLTSSQSQIALEGLCKQLYGKVFDFIVGHINSSLRNDMESRKRVMLLDIFGFEIFPENSLEQLCINFANELLHKQFCKTVFEDQLTILQKECIDCSGIGRMADNTPSLELLGGKPISVLGLLDEECLVPKGKDSAFLTKVARQFQKTPCFSVDPAYQVNKIFNVKHFAGEVSYSVKGMCAKNKTNLLKATEDAARSSKIAMLSQMFPEQPTSPIKRGRRQKRRLSGVIGQTVCGMFRSQLAELVSIINNTSNHYVHCIRASDVAISGEFKNDVVLRQLRSGGIMEAIQIGRVAFPIRIKQPDFLNRYSCLGARLPTKYLSPKSSFLQQKFSLPSSNHLSLSRTSSKTSNSLFGGSSPNGTGSNSTIPSPRDDLITANTTTMSDSISSLDSENSNKARIFGPSADCRFFLASVFSEQDYAVGMTKIFLRNNAHRSLEEQRRIIRETCVVQIQKTVRGWICRSFIKRINNSMITLQRSFRKRHFHQSMAATTIQSFWKCKLYRARYVKQFNASKSLGQWWIRQQTIKYLLNEAHVARTRLLAKQQIRRWWSSAKIRLQEQRIAEEAAEAQRLHEEQEQEEQKRILEEQQERIRLLEQEKLRNEQQQQQEQQQAEQERLLEERQKKMEKIKLLEEETLQNEQQQERQASKIIKEEDGDFEIIEINIQEPDGEVGHNEGYNNKEQQQIESPTSESDVSPSNSSMVDSVDTETMFMSIQEDIHSWQDERRSYHDIIQQLQQQLQEQEAVISNIQERLDEHAVELKAKDKKIHKLESECKIKDNRIHQLEHGKSIFEAQTDNLINKNMILESKNLEKHFESGIDVRAALTGDWWLKDMTLGQLKR
eukprot:TRINITY_DN36_c1_g2_i1.p1 TRINITY_DN36_c1_g2~~TRINITY_DN36_c1_g2_i1.p1  ORF type:complete len:1158 (-),score=319.62 TRINITY_DN36_c1_g2_i1:166-3486(-)